jgi:type IV secretory pathway TrbL component
VSKTYKYLPIYLGRYLYNKFLASLLGIVLNCVFKVFPFILIISVYDNFFLKYNNNFL